MWRFYERNHPHSLWHGDFFEKVTLTDEDRTAYQFTLMDDYSRAYVYCDLLREPIQNDTIRAMIAAMRKYQTIPKGVVFDNGSQFKGYLLSAFCSNLGIRLIHSSVRHPQTNGKLERAFRDDRREYEVGYEKWTPSTEGFSILIGGIHDGEVTPAGLHQRFPPAGGRDDYP
jgi:transposase InsO family protein